MVFRHLITTPSRTTLTAVSLVCILMTTGCLGFILGDNALSIESEPVAVSNSTLSDTDYEQVRGDAITFNTSVSVGDQERTVNATSHVREYSRDANFPATDMAVTRFVTLSTPKAEVGGESLNPIGDRSNSQLAERLLGSYDGIESPEHVNNRTVTSLDGERTISTYEATAQITQNIQIPVMLHVTSFAHDDDYITVLAVHPKQIDEQARIDRLLAGLEHPA